MQKITFDFSKCTRWYEVFDEIITKCDFPEWCGKNLDAIWDFMEDDFVLWNEPALITIIGTKKCREMQFRHLKRLMKRFLLMLKELHPM